MRTVFFATHQTSLSGVYVRDFHWLLHGTIYTCDLFVIPLLTADRGFVEAKGVGNTTGTGTG